jgi:hypothetical protein
MIKKLIAFSVVLLLPVSFISSASAASKSITCYKGTAKKVVKNSTGKCPTGWSSKKPVTPKTPANASNASYKIQDISAGEVAILINAYDKAVPLYNDALANDKINYDNCLVSVPYNASLVNEILSLKSIISITEQRLAQSMSEIEARIIRDTQGLDSPEVKKLNLELIESTKIKVDQMSITLTSSKSSLKEKEAMIQAFELARNKCKEKIAVSTSGKTVIDFYVSDKSSSKVISKLVQNFCGLNGQILKRDLEAINDSDLLIGYEKFNNTVMKLIFSDLEIMAKNRELTISTPDTDRFITMLYPNVQITYGSAILNQKLWSEAIGKTDYGISVSTDRLQTLIKSLKSTVNFCNNF